MSGVCSNNARTRGSKTVNDVGIGVRSYRGGESEFTALITVVREIPNLRAIPAFGTPSAASLLISAQSSKVITLQSLSAHFSPPKVFSFRAPPTVGSVLLAGLVLNAHLGWCWPTRSRPGHGRRRRG
jgi:hypothetical protein